MVFILGTIAAIAAPRFGNAANSYRLESAMKKIELDVEYALRMARAQSKSIEISFDPDTDSYELVGVKDPLDTKLDFVVRLGEPPYRVRLADVRFGGGSPSTLTISGHGTMVNKGIVRIELGPSARLIGFSGGAGSPVGQSIPTAAVPTKEEQDDISSVVPADFLEGG